MINDTTRKYPRSLEEAYPKEDSPIMGPYTDHGLKEPPTVVPVAIWIVVMALALALVFVRMYGG
jgi:hypothetical protein